MEVVLDTNAYSDWLRSGLWSDQISQATKVFVPMVVIGELYHGFHGRSRFQKNEGILLDFLGENAGSTLGANLKVANQFGQFMSYLQQRGTKIPTNDVWLAATSHLSGSTLLSEDDHFDYLPQLRRMRSGD